MKMNIKKNVILLFAIILSTQMFSQDKFYKVENVIVEYKTSIMGMDNFMTLYVKNYGEFECNDSKTSLFGVKSFIRTISTNDYYYDLNMIAKTGTKSSMTDYVPEDETKEVDFDNLSEEYRVKYSIEKLGDETFLGKKCQKFKMMVEGNAGMFWIWNNIPLKTEVSSMGMKMIMEAIKVDDSPSFPAGIFEVPAGFTITE